MACWGQDDGMDETSLLQYVTWLRDQLRVPVSPSLSYTLYLWLCIYCLLVMDINTIKHLLVSYWYACDEGCFLLCSVSCCGVVVSIPVLQAQDPPPRSNPGGSTLLHFSQQIFTSQLPDYSVLLYSDGRSWASLYNIYFPDQSVSSAVWQFSRRLCCRITSTCRVCAGACRYCSD